MKKFLKGFNFITALLLVGVMTVCVITLISYIIAEGQQLGVTFETIESRNDYRNVVKEEQVEEVKEVVEFVFLTNNLVLLKIENVEFEDSEVAESEDSEENEVGVTPISVNTYTTLYRVFNAPFGDGYVVEREFIENLLGYREFNPYLEIFEENSVIFTDYDEELAWEMQGEMYLSVDVLEKVSGGKLIFNIRSKQLECSDLPFILDNAGPVGGPFEDPKYTPVHDGFDSLVDLLKSHPEDWTVLVDVKDYWSDNSYILSRKGENFNWTQKGSALRIYDSEGIRYFVFDEMKEAVIFPIHEIPPLREPLELLELLDFDFRYHLLLNYGRENFQGVNYFYEKHVVLGQYEIQYFLDDLGRLIGFIQTFRDGNVRTVNINRNHQASQEIFADVYLYERESEDGFQLDLGFDSFESNTESGEAGEVGSGFGSGFDDVDTGVEDVVGESESSEASEGFGIDEMDIERYTRLELSWDEFLGVLEERGIEVYFLQDLEIE